MLPWKRNKHYVYWMCLYPYLSRVQSACVVLYCHLWHVRLHHNFSTLSHKEHNFEKENKCFDFLYSCYLKHFSFYENFSKIPLQMYIVLYVKYQLFLSYFKEVWIFYEGCSKYNQISNFIKIRPVGAEVFDVDGKDGRTDMMKLAVGFCNLAKAPSIRNTV